jgi:hypothetical protein
VRSPILIALAALLALAHPASAGQPYTPVPLKPAQTVTPPAELLTAARSFLDAVSRGDGDAIFAGLAPKISSVDGALELGIPRRKETIGPFKTVEAALSELANNIGGTYEMPAGGVDFTPFATKAEREFIVQSLTDGQPWGLDPLLKGATCTYAYRSFDTKAVTALGKKLDTQTSSFFYLDAKTDVLASPAAGAPVAATLEPDRLYGLDYDTDAPRSWMAVHLPAGGSGFVNFQEVELNKPYATGICFSKAADGRWLMSAQAATNL